MFVPFRQHVQWPFWQNMPSPIHPDFEPLNLAFFSPQLPVAAFDVPNIMPCAKRARGMDYVTNGPSIKRPKFAWSETDPDSFIEISSDDELETNTTQHHWVKAVWNCETGIAPTDSLQDVVLKSTESGDNSDLDSKDDWRGLKQYQCLLEETQYEKVTTTFDSYRLVPPPNTSVTHPIHPFEVDISRGPKFGGLAWDLSRTASPAFVSNYAQRIYTSITTNALIPLAILHIAMKNLPHINWTSSLQSLPIGFDDPFPSWPYAFEEKEILFMEDFQKHHKYEMPGGGVVVTFLPHFYKDGRHAIGWYTEVAAYALRRSTMVFTPCSTSDLEAAKVIRLVGAGENKVNFARTLHVQQYWGLEIGAADGDWLHPHEHGWSMELKVVSEEWQRRIEAFQGVQDRW